MHSYLGSPTNQTPVINEGTAQSLSHLQGYEANATFPANSQNVAQGAAPAPASVENVARGLMAQIKVTSVDVTENGKK